jgi:ribonuclease I
MATTREQIEELRKEIQRLKNESMTTRRILREHGLWPVNRKRAAHLSERERARLILRQANVVRDMTPAEQALADEWRALPAEEQREVEEALRQVRIDPPLSQLIHKMRG